MYINGYLIGNCHHFCDRFSGGHCSCGGCFERGEVTPYRAPSESVEVQIVPVPGERGEDGTDGQDGATPEISNTTNNWVINGVDTGKPSVGSSPLPTGTEDTFIII